MRVFVVAGMMMLLWAGAAIAQPQEGKSPAQIEADKAAERAYKQSLGNIPDQGPVDPWGAVRSTDAPKQSAAKATKTKGSAASN